MKEIPSAIFVLTLILILQGCSIFTPPLQQPLITDYQSSQFASGEREFGSSSLTASRRMVLFKLQDKDFLRVCAEPPPTVGEELSKAIQVAIQASASQTETEKKGEVSGSLLSTLNTSIVKLEKAKGVQFEQDMLYSICQMYMNGALDGERVRESIFDVAARTERILLAEIAVEKQQVPFAGKILTLTHVIKDNENLSLQLHNNKQNRFFSDMKIGVRKYIKNQQIETGWVRFTPSSTKGEIIKATFTKGTLGLSDGDILEAALIVTPSPGADEQYSISTGRFVFYGTDGDKAIIENLSQNSFVDDNAAVISIKYPINADIAFPGFKSQLLVDGYYKTLTSEMISFEPITQISSLIDKGSSQYKLNLNDSDRSKLNEARASGDTVIKLKFNDGENKKPLIQDAILKEFAEPSQVTSFTLNSIVTSDGNASVKVSWNHDGHNVTHFKLERRENGGDDEFSTVTNKVKNYVRSYDDNNVSKDKEYQYRITAYNISRGSGSTLQTVNIAGISK